MRHTGRGKHYSQCVSVWPKLMYAGMRVPLGKLLEQLLTYFLLLPLLELQGMIEPLTQNRRRVEAQLPALSGLVAEVGVYP